LQQNAETEKASKTKGGYTVNSSNTTVGGQSAIQLKLSGTEAVYGDTETLICIMGSCIPLMREVARIKLSTRCFKHSHSSNKEFAAKKPVKISARITFCKESFFNLICLQKFSEFLFFVVYKPIFAFSPSNYWQITYSMLYCVIQN